MDKQQLFDDLNSFFDSFLESKGIDLETTKLTTNRYNSIMMYLYNTYVYKLELTTSKGFKQYSYIDYCNLIEWYIAKSLYLDMISLYGFCLLINRTMTFLNDSRYMDNIELLNSFIIDVNNINNKYSSNIYNNISSVNDDISTINTIDTINNADSDRNTVRINENASELIKCATQKLYETATQSTVNKLNDTTIGLVTNANNNKDIGLMYAKERIEAGVKARQTISLSDLPLLE